MIILDFLSDYAYSVLGILSYIAFAYGLYCMSRTCGLSHPLLAWFPYCSAYQTGALADRVTERGEGRKTSYRHILLWLSISIGVLVAVSVTTLLVAILQAILTAGYDANSEAELLGVILPAILSSIFLWLMVAAAGIVYVVFYLIALHRIYKAFDPKNSTLFTVLSILVPYASSVIFFLLAKKRPTYDIDPAPVAEPAPAAEPEPEPVFTVNEDGPTSL